jgi:putative transposon-encoded protein
MNDQVTAVYNQCIEKFPNSSMITGSYSYLLIEGATDFVKALKIKHRSFLIEEKIKFVVDLSFRSLMSIFHII